ncbi:MAG: hypothetical protein GX133_04030 [Syntrophomonadaceae bacterium]|nr:hypothetical protein [Syntrophomonadaceae bacterium]
MESPGQATPYITIVEDMIQKLRTELDQQVQPVTASTDQEGLDQYLLDLNTYYYQSFHQHFMPQYREASEDNLRRIYRLSRQEQSLQADLLNALRLCINVYNRTRSGARQLQDLRANTHQVRMRLQSEAETRPVDLLYLLKEHVEDWTRFIAEVDVARSLKAHKPLLDTLERFPACKLAASLFRTGNFQDRKDKREFNRLLSQWQLGIRMLDRLLNNPHAGKELLYSLADELEKIDSSWDSRKALPAVRMWYKQNVQPGFQLYLETLRSYGSRPDQRRASRLAVQFQDWLQAWLQTLEQYFILQSRGWDQWFDRLPDLRQLDGNLLLELADFGLRNRRALDELIASLTGSPAGSYASFSQSGGQILNEANRYLQEWLDSPPASLSPLRYTVRKLNGEVEMALRVIALLDERETRAREVMAAYQNMQPALDRELEILDALGVLMEQMLDTRALQNRFGDMAPEIEHVAIKIGTILPAAWARLIEKGLIATQTAEAPEGLILQAEGDIFVIRMDEQVIEEIPKIVVAGKG